MKKAYIPYLYASLLSTTLILSSCKKEDDMIVDRTAAPVLVLVNGSSFDAAEPVKVTVSIYELDKSGILDHSVGIDSIPVSNLSITLYKTGADKIEEVTTDADGKVTVTKSWAELGVATPAKGNTVNLEWSGNYKGQAFTKQSKVQVK